MPDNSNNTNLSDGTTMTSDANDMEKGQTLKNLDWMGGKLFPVIGQVLAIGAVVAAGMIGTGAALFAGLAMFSFEIGRAYLSNQADQWRELELYRGDITRVAGKAPGTAITIEDMYKAAETIKPLKTELDHLSYRSRYNYLMGAARAAVTTFGALVMGSVTSQAAMYIKAGNWEQVGGSLFYPLTGSLAAIGMATFGIEKLGKGYFNAHKPPTAYKELIALQEAVRQRPIEPEAVFSLDVKIDKTLAENIRRRTGKPYEDLTHANKQAMVEAYEPQVHAATLAKHINAGRLGVTAIALNAFQQIEWTNPALAPVAEQDNDIPAKTHEFSMMGKRDVSYAAAYNDEKTLPLGAMRDR